MTAPYLRAAAKFPAIKAKAVERLSKRQGNGTGPVKPAKPDKPANPTRNGG